MCPQKHKKNKVIVQGDLQSSQQVTGLPQSGPGGIQLLQQLVLRLLQSGDLSLSHPDVLLPSLHLLLQPSDLWVGVGWGQPDQRTGLDREADHELHAATHEAVFSVWRKFKEKRHQHFMLSNVEFPSKMDSINPPPLIFK